MQRENALNRQISLKTVRISVLTAASADENARRTERAADFMVQEYGERAVEEAEAALRYAEEQNNKDAIAAFREIIGYLKSRT